ncbi:MAG: methyltransferase domain-containing protein [Armatimonadetes bacterium]|nr:methyltransferase domain-containing protein [Armatimonadota bacterium]
MGVRSSLKGAWRIYREHGLRAVLQQSHARLLHDLPLSRRLHAAGSFTYQGRRYPWFHHPYNRTWYNERAVEVAVIGELLATPGRILEVGNVLSHYFPQNHDVIDKYEAGPGVVNVDVAEFTPSAPYDLVVSISTFEHVGFDEPEPDPEKAPRALARALTWLAPGGRLVVTLPLGYNPQLDAWLLAGETPFDTLTWYRRRPWNRWVETTGQKAVAAGYDHARQRANGLLIAEATR